jgi:NAD(P)-dependent dehydrogenase (short-subunit alcohol dehydrogenase family)
MPAETRDLTDTVVAITGGTSGIGAAAARLLAEAGARVVVGARREERLEALARELGDERCAVVPMDTTVPADAERLVATAIERFGRLDSIVVNAGIGKYGGILDGSDAEMAEIIDVNLTGSVWPVGVTSSSSRRWPGSAEVTTRPSTPQPSSARWVSPAPSNANYGPTASG